MALDEAHVPDPLIAECRRVLEMVSELHVRGFQQLRVVPFIYALGTWRCGITWADNIRSDHGAIACDFRVMPQYTSASRRTIFGWTDATEVTPSRLADMFIERFPEVAMRGKGQDGEYAGWFSWMLRETYPDCLPIAFGDELEVPPDGMITVGARESKLTPPPVGRGQCIENDSAADSRSS